MRGKFESETSHVLKNKEMDRSGGREEEEERGKGSGAEGEKERGGRRKEQGGGLKKGAFFC